MAADGNPWTKWFHEDFLQGVGLANMEAAEIGVYAVILNLMAARGGPIEDDRRWIAGRAGCKSTRQCSAIITRLVSAGKLVARNGMLGNAKMLGVIEQRDRKSDQARRAALARWHGDDLELPLGDPNADLSGQKTGRKSEDKSAVSGAVKSDKPQKSAASDDADASPPVRARDSETQNNLTLPTPETVEPEVASGGSGREEQSTGRLGDADLQQLYEAVAAASGHNPSNPTQINRAMGFVEQWRRDGIDFEQVVIPTIKAVISESRDPTRTLGRFDARIRHEHARVAATPNGRAYLPPASPILEPEDEDPLFRPMRAILLERLGPLGYASLVNPVRFEVVEVGLGKNERRVVRTISDGAQGSRLMDGDRASIVRNAARAIGFTEVW